MYLNYCLFRSTWVCFQLFHSCHDWLAYVPASFTKVTCDRTIFEYAQPLLSTLATPACLNDNMYTWVYLCVLKCNTHIQDPCIRMWLNTIKHTPINLSSAMYIELTCTYTYRYWNTLSTMKTPMYCWTSQRQLKYACINSIRSKNCVHPSTPKCSHVIRIKCVLACCMLLKIIQIDSVHDCVHSRISLSKCKHTQSHSNVCIYMQLHINAFEYMEVRST